MTVATKTKEKKAAAPKQVPIVEQLRWYQVYANEGPVYGAECAVRELEQKLAAAKKEAAFQKEKAVAVRKATGVEELLKALGMEAWHAPLVKLLNGMGRHPSREFKPWAKLQAAGATDDEIAKNIERGVGCYGTREEGGYELRAGASGFSLSRYRNGSNYGTKDSILSGKDKVVREVRRLLGIPQPEGAASKPEAKKTPAKKSAGAKTPAADAKASAATTPAADAKASASKGGVGFRRQTLGQWAATLRNIKGGFDLMALPEKNPKRVFFEAEYEKQQRPADAVKAWEKAQPKFGDGDATAGDDEADQEPEGATPVSVQRRGLAMPPRHLPPSEFGEALFGDLPAGVRSYVSRLVEGAQLRESQYAIAYFRWNRDGKKGTNPDRDFADVGEQRRLQIGRDVLNAAAGEGPSKTKAGNPVPEKPPTQRQTWYQWASNLPAGVEPVGVWLQRYREGMSASDVNLQYMQWCRMVRDEGGIQFEDTHPAAVELYGKGFVARSAAAYMKGEDGVKPKDPELAKSIDTISRDLTSKSKRLGKGKKPPEADDEPEFLPVEAFAEGLSAADLDNAHCPALHPNGGHGGLPTPAGFRPRIGVPVEGTGGELFVAVLKHQMSDRVVYHLHHVIPNADYEGIPLSYQELRARHSKVAPEDMPLEGLGASAPTGNYVFGKQADRYRVWVPRTDAVGRANAQRARELSAAAAAGGSRNGGEP